MKKFNKKRFTMVEMMMIVGILCILISISWVAGTTIIRKSALAQTKAELKMLHAAVEMYKDRYGSYPASADTEFNFVQELSKVPVGANYKSGESVRNRPMFVEFRSSGFNLSNGNFDDVNATETIARDPYDQDYMYVYDDKSTTSTADDTFFIYSEGLTSTSGYTDDDDVRSDELDE